jgi:hypothetical protein
MTSNLKRSSARRPGVAAAALLLAAAGTGVAVQAASAAAPVKVALSGKTSQGIKVSLSPPKSFGGRTITYKATMTCSDGQTFTDDAFSDDVTISKAGHFDLHYTSDAGATLTAVQGAVSSTGRSASGSLRIVEFYSETPDANNNLPLMAGGPVRCDSGAVTWKAGIPPKKK